MPMGRTPSRAIQKVRQPRWSSSQEANRPANAASSSPGCASAVHRAAQLRQRRVIGLCSRTCTVVVITLLGDVRIQSAPGGSPGSGACPDTAAGLRAARVRDGPRTDHRPAGYRQVHDGGGRGPRRLGAALLGHDWAMSGLRPYREMQEALDAMDPPGLPRRRVVDPVGAGPRATEYGVARRPRRGGVPTGGGRFLPGGRRGGGPEPRRHDPVLRSRRASHACRGSPAAHPELVRAGLGSRGPLLRAVGHARRRRSGPRGHGPGRSERGCPATDDRFVALNGATTGCAPRGPQPPLPDARDGASGHGDCGFPRRGGLTGPEHRRAHDQHDDQEADIGAPADHEPCLAVVAAEGDSDPDRDAVEHGNDEADPPEPRGSKFPGVPLPTRVSRGTSSSSRR